MKLITHRTLAIVALSILVVACVPTADSTSEASGPTPALPAVTPSPTAKAPVIDIVYVKASGDAVGLYGMTLDGAEHRLTSDRLTREPIRFVPASNEIVYVAATEGGQMLKAIDLGDLSVRSILPGSVPQILSPAVSADGSLIAYHFKRENGAEFGRHDMRIVNGQDGREIAHVENAWYAAWASRRNSLVYTDSIPRQDVGVRRVWIRDEMGTTLEIAINASIEVITAYWGNDDRELFVIGENPLTRPNLYRVEPANGALEQVTEKVMVYHPVTISPIGSDVAFVSTPNDGNTLYILDNGQVPVRPLDLPPGVYLEFGWSRDGKQIVLSALLSPTYVPRLILIDLATRDWEQVPTPVGEYAILYPLFVK